jgi:SAM-dependent methyltransferase
MPVSVAMVESLGLQPGQRVLELAAGPGDTGFMAAELVRPGGTLISSDGAEPMIEVARARAAQLGIDNVEFRQLELEWIDLETATVEVWDVRERNPWALIPSAALLELGHTEPPDPDAPGPFALAAEGRLAELLEDAGFTDVEVMPVSLERRYATARDIVAESANCSPSFASTYKDLTEEQQAEVAGHMVAAAAPYTAPDGSVTLPGVSLVAHAAA